MKLPSPRHYQKILLAVLILALLAIYFCKRQPLDLGKIEADLAAGDSLDVETFGDIVQHFEKYDLPDSTYARINAELQHNQFINLRDTALAHRLQILKDSTMSLAAKTSFFKDKKYALFSLITKLFNHCLYLKKFAPGKKSELDESRKAAETAIAIYDDPHEKNFLLSQRDFYETLPPEHLETRLRLEYLTTQSHGLSESDPNRALQHLGAGLKLARILGDQKRKIDLLTNLQFILYNNFGFTEIGLGFGKRLLAESDSIGYIVKTGGIKFQNGHCHLDKGQFPKAFDEYKYALELYENYNYPPMIIRMHERMGVVLRRMGEFGKAIENYEKIFQREKEFNETSAEIDYLIGRGLVYAEMGKNVAADSFYQQALGLAKISRDPTERAIVLGNLGNLYLDIGHYEKARAVTEEAYALIDSVGNPHTKISLSNILIEILAETNQYEDAKLLAEKTLRKLTKHQFGLLEADSYLCIGKLHFQIGDWQKAFELFEQARAISEKKGFIVNHIESLTMLAETCRRQAQLKSATEFINTALKLCKRYPFADPKWHAYFGLARIERDTGDIAAAEANFDEAIGIVKTLAAEIKDTEGRSNFSEKIQPIFEEMVLLQLAQNDNDDAHFYAELERAQVFKVLLQQNFTGKAAPESITVSTFQLGKKENPLSFTLPNLQSLLRANELVVEYELTESLLIIWVIGRNTFAVATKTISRNTINNWVKDFRTCTNLDTLYNRAKVAENYTKIESLCRRFYDELISPIAEHLSDAGLIYFIPDETLNYLSFAALMDNAGEFLIRRHPIVMMPSAEILYQLLSSKTSSTVGSNTLLVAATNPDLEYSFVEARVVAKKFAEVDSLIGEGKTELELKHKLTTKSFDVILLSLHGRVNEKRPHLSSLVLNRAIAESSAVMDNDAQLMLSEIQPLPLDATNLVYLSACESASGRLYRGEGIVGLQRAFLIAGASSVIANLWKIDDKSAQKQTEAFFDIWLQKKISKAQALQEAQLNLIDNLKNNPVYKGKAHPCLWASVTLTGIPN